MPRPNIDTETTGDTPREFVRFGGGHSTVHLTWAMFES